MKMPAWFENVDPGIRETVHLLMEAGFMTMDSGDGISKYAEYDGEGVPPAPCPHVWLMPVCNEGEAGALCRQLDAWIEAHPGLPVDEAVVLEPWVGNDDDEPGYSWVVGVIGPDVPGSVARFKAAGFAWDLDGKEENGE